MILEFTALANTEKFWFLWVYLMKIYERMAFNAVWSVAPNQDF